MMPVKRRSGITRHAELPAEALDWLHGGKGGAWVYFQSPEELAALWAEQRDEILAEYIAEYPGTRPLRWWERDAPEPRQRLGGTGTPAHERLANVLRLHFGVPADWITHADIERYESLNVPALDPTDPPLYESEPAYLKRFKLLSAAERRQLTTQDFEPVSVMNILATT